MVTKGRLVLGGLCAKIRSVEVAPQGDLFFASSRIPRPAINDNRQMLYVAQLAAYQM